MLVRPARSVRAGGRLYPWPDWPRVANRNRNQTNARPLESPAQRGRLPSPSLLAERGVDDKGLDHSGDQCDRFTMKMREPGASKKGVRSLFLTASNLRPFPRIAKENMPRQPQKASKRGIEYSRPYRRVGTVSLQEHRLAGPADLAWFTRFARQFREPLPCQGAGPPDTPVGTAFRA